MIQQLLDSDLELVIQSGFIHVPLLFDPSVDREREAPPKPDTLIQVNGRQFVKAVSLQSLLDTYPTIHPEPYEQMKRTCLQEYPVILRLGRVPVDERLETLLFQVMPHFIRGHRGLERRRLSEGEILDLIERKVSIPARCYDEARALLDTNSLRGAVKELEKQGTAIAPLKDGLTSARRLGEWLQWAVEQRILEGEKARVRQAVQQQEEPTDVQRRHLAVLLHIAEESALEIDGFGFSRMGPGDEYCVYKRTGEYALKDFYGRLYLFPDCRVAVSTILPLKPFVMENYKHPFLEGHDSGQDICMRGFTAPNAFAGEGMISALEEGVNALLYGYSSRRRNGYHSLEGRKRQFPVVDFDEPAVPWPMDYPVIRKRHILDVDFADYRVPNDHPKIASGQVEVTNSFTP